MSLLGNQTNITPKDYFFLLANVSTLKANNIQALSVSTGTLGAGIANINLVDSLGISTGYLQVDSISSLYTETNYLEVSSAAILAGNISSIITNNITLDGNTIDTGGAGFGAILLLNGLPIATGTSSLSSIQDWSYFPAVSSLRMDSNDIINAGNITCQNIYNALNIQTDTLAALTSLTAPTAVITNLRNTNFSSINIVSSNAAIRAGSFLTLSTGTLTGAVSSLNISTGSINGQPFISGSNWSQYPATSAVNMNQNSLNGGSNFAINCSNLVITASNSFSNVCDDFTVVADEGANIASVANINLTAQNGTYGAVNITANGGFNNGINGVVNITANGSQVGGVGQGGSINLTANTPVGFSNLTSKIALNASGVNSYAGAIPSVASLAGYNFLYGQAGVNIISGPIPSLIPNIPLTTYLYGTAGIVLNSDVYTSAIYPYWDGVSASNGDLSIQGRVVNLTNQVYVTLSNVKYLDMDFFALIRQVKGINFCNTYSNNYISNADTIQGSNSISGFQTISGTNINFTTASGATVNTNNLTASNSVTTNSITSSNLVSTTRINMSSVQGYALLGTLGNFSTLNTSSIVSPVYGQEFRIVNTLPGSLSGGTGPASVSRLIAEKPSGISTIAQIVAADTGMAVAAFRRDGGLTNMLLNASTISTSAATFNSLSFGCSTINGQALPYPYGSFTANFSQLLGVAGTSLSTIYDTTEINNGIYLVGASTTKVAVSTSGVYRWIASPQFDTSSGGQNTVEFWFQQNGTPLPRTASRMTIQNNGELFSCVEIMTKMNAQDYIETCFTSADTNMNLAYYPASGVVPAVPAIILNGQKIAES